MANEECMRSNWSETSIYLDLIKQNKIILPTTRCLKELPDTFQRRQLLLFRMNTEISHITNQESKCPFCQEHDTREHILNGCQSETMGNLYTKRHNLVVNILVRNILNKLKISSKKQLTRGQMKQYGNITVYYDRPIATEVSSNKPDVIIITNNEGIILEVAVSGYTTMNTKRMEKIGKYTPLESDLTSSHKKQFKIYAIVIGSNGELDVDCFNEWIKVMEHYKINKKWSKNILNTIRQKVNAFSDYLFRTYLSMKQQINMETNEMAQF
uniref:Zf-RVT domain-containing protein n=1 Tax=Strongyloides papillosus TaxID=174720 RepID=A0A0N5BXW5_STREA